MLISAGVMVRTMFDTGRFHFFCLALFSFISMELMAEEALASDKKDWRIGVAVFDTDASDTFLLPISTVLSGLVRDELTKAQNHSLSEREKRSLAQDFIEKKELEHLKNLEGYYDKRDAFLFDLNANPADLTKEEENIRTELQALAKTRNLSLREIAAPNSLDIVFPEAASGSTLWDLGEAMPGIFREKNELDILITGSIVRVGDYYGIIANAWTEGGKTVLWEGAADNAELVDISLAIASAARGLALGRPWASLNVTVEPPSGIISVNGKLAGVGYWSDGTLSPGEVTIEVSAHGYKPVIQKKVLQSGQHIDVSISMESAETNQVLVRSVPSGASVRLGTLWLGMTPLSVTAPDRIMPLSLEKEGFRNRTVPFSPTTERLTIPLVEDLIDPNEKMTAARRKFDNAAAWFSFSLAPTLIFLGISQNYQSMSSASTSQADLQAASTSSAIFTGAMWGSVALNAGLLVITLVNLGRYLNAVEELTD